MKDRFAIFCGKFVYYLGKKFTSCSSLPGKIALNIEKNLLKNIKKENNTIIFQSADKALILSVLFLCIFVFS